jgi:hypothetical protein
MRAGLPDRRADARHVLDENQQGDSAGFRPRGRKRLPLLRRRLPGQPQGQGRPVKYVEGINGPANEGRLCVKGRFGFDYIHHDAPPDQAADPQARTRPPRG